MLVDFFFTVRKAGVPASVKEFLTLLAALERGVVSASVDEFYVLSRATLVKDEAHFDRFDLAFSAYFKGVAAIPDDLVRDIPEEWLRKLAERHLTDADMPLFTQLRMTAFGQTVIDLANDPACDEWTFSQKIFHALDKEITARSERRTQKLLKASRSPNPDACVEEIRVLRLTSR